MIDLETVARIRQLHYGEHWPVGTIAKELGLHHETVQRALSDAWVLRARRYQVAATLSIHANRRRPLHADSQRSSWRFLV